MLTEPVIEGVVFDMDGVLVESEQVWDEVRRRLVADAGRSWTDEATAAMQGMSTPEWSRYLVEELGVPGPAEQVAERTITGVAESYGQAPPRIDGAVEVVREVAGRWPLALASSSPPRLIRAVLEAAELQDLFRVTVSSEQVERGKPAPDVYLEACSQLGLDPARGAAVEDSSNGIRSAAAAGLAVIAVPNAAFPPQPDALALAAAVAGGLRDVPGLLAQR